jgi:hypothetical protein
MQLLQAEASCVIGIFLTLHESPVAHPNVAQA